MELEYDQKFEEMKKYIPFLESMIKRLESTSSAAANPRQAQLDKIRSLRDLLLDKKKRMKMDNLLKCEQVLVNLYAKVEQRDALPEKPKPEVPYPLNIKKEDKDLEIVRNKLKSVTTKTFDDTLPEISRASEMEEICTPGSKEPALFQRRPNKHDGMSPGRATPKSPNKSVSQSSAKRNYTRVLVSPEPRRWNAEDELQPDPPLFSRRSPTRKSPKRYSPSLERKKEKKKSFKQKVTKKAKDLNITLNVPEDSLDSLNTKDILSRIMNCNDNDMDIETLREAKRQILSELKQTGAKYDDISDLLLKSYKSKSTIKKKDDVEEGELSDSESEAIESIYGGLKNSSLSGKVKKSDGKEHPRKIQICLVINSEKGGTTSEVTKVNNVSRKLPETDASDFQMYDEKVTSTELKSDSDSKNNDPDPSSPTPARNDETQKKVEDETAPENIDEVPNDCDPQEKTPKLANFYKPMIEQKPVNEKKDQKDSQNSKTETEGNNIHEQILLSPNKSTNQPKVDTENTNDTVSSTLESKDIEIPLLHEPVPKVEKPKEDVVSEIDILQALKNEILGESLSITGSDTTTPALHQPKLTKVASAQEIAPKKRISIEKYKKKAVPTQKTPNSLFVKDPPMTLKEEQARKQSLKLTMKECERFNFPVKLALDDDSSDEERVDGNDVSVDDIYNDIAPKSPDNDDSSDIASTPPIIIPVDPVKNTDMVTPSRADVDMRTLIPPHMSNVVPKPTNSPNVSRDSLGNEMKSKQDKSKAPSDPRMRRDLNRSTNVESSPFHHCMNPDRASLTAPPVIFPNMTPSRTPSRNPSMTPSRTPIMTPNARTFEMEEHTTQKHVYTPMFSAFDQHERETSVARDHIPTYKPEIDNESRCSRWDTDRDLNSSRKWDDRNPRSGSMQRDDQNSRFGDSFKGHKKYQKNTKYSIDRRSDCPRTPVHPFGRSDVPSSPFMPNIHDVPRTPVHPFGRSDCPSTPSHSFGRSDCPPTPSHPFGRHDAPATPIHPFGRSDCPTTPSHPFGRGEMPMTPSHPFGRSDNVPRDPRLNRSSDFDNYQKNDREHSGHYRDCNKSYENSDSYNAYREQSARQNEYRNDRYKYSSHDRGGHQYNRDNRRERSVGRAMSRDIDNDRLFSRDRSYGNKQGNDFCSESENPRGSNDHAPSRGFYRERSVGRSAPDDRQYRSSSRAPSVSKCFQNENVRTTSVKPDAGRSFTIDTSVNSTFQDFLNGKKIQVFDYTPDNRRKRAASVGRSLCRESSVGRTFPPEAKPIYEKIENTKRNDFKRASSVGRDNIAREEKSFKDIKADFESFKSRNMVNQTRLLKNTINFNRLDELANDMSNLKDKKSTIGSKNTNSDTTKPYSPKKNNRDPRMQRFQEGNKNKARYRNRKHSGIVYSNDNITRGTILASGYGVKNYKIPKIKRPVVEIEEKIEKTENEKKKDGNKIDVQKKPVLSKADVEKKEISQKTETLKLSQSNKEDKIKKGDKSKKPTSTLSEKNTKEMKIPGNNEEETSTDSPEFLDNVEKRVTRSCRKSDTIVVNTTEKVKVRTSRKPIIYDSDSDEDTVEEKPQKNIPQNAESSHQKSSTEKVSKNLNDNENTNDTNFESQLGDQLDSSFGIDDLFSDNIVSDPVIDNINALIADLDNELGPNKIVTPNDFSNDLIENMLESITNPQKEDTKSLNEDDSLNDISEVIKNDLNESDKSIETEKTTNYENKTAKETQKDLNESDKSIETEKTTKYENKTANETQKLIIAKNDSENISMAYKQPKVEITTKPDSPSPKKKSLDQSIEAYKSQLVEVPKNDKIDNSKAGNTDSVSTTTDSDRVSEKIGDKEDEQSAVDGHSTPDSTINTNLIGPMNQSQESIPDSTNELQNENNSMVSSTHNSVDTSNKDNTEPSSSNKDATPAIESIGSILSMLQNKSKIKELLSLLGDQVSDNDKIKKKLEMLSEIVSDEEDEAIVDKAEFTEKRPEGKNQSTVTASVFMNEKSTKDSNELKENLFDDNLDNSKLNNEEKKKDSTVNNEVAKFVGDINKVSKCETVKGDKATNEIGITTIEKGTNINKNKTITAVETITNFGKSAPNEDETVTNKEKKATNKEKSATIEEETVNKDIETASNEKAKMTDKIVTAKKNPTKRGKWAKKKACKKNLQTNAKRVTRSAIGSKNPKKKRAGELLKLQEDIKEMFIKDDVLNATGIRMCRLAKLVDEQYKEDAVLSNQEPLVVIEKAKEMKAFEEKQLSVKVKKKPGPKPKLKIQESHQPKNTSYNVAPPKYKPGPKSKTKVAQIDDPYEFESDSVSDIMNDETNKSVGEKDYDSSASESESLASSKSYDSSEVLNDLKKKPKRKRSGWQSGIIKPRTKKKKTETKPNDVSLNDDSPMPKKNGNIPDYKCFTDKSYCFRKNVFTYSCRLCLYSGEDIVAHYKQHHPHSEIPLSRMNPETAREAIEQCEEVNFQAISKIPTEKYVCRFCFKEFARKKSVLESFFWHIVSMHTGEYKQLCSECPNTTKCPYNLDIPPPPKDVKGQLIGYICEKCNFTQISLENLKTHVIVRHNDEQTEVYTINLAVMTRITINKLLKRFNASDTSKSKPRVLRSSRSNQSVTETSDDHSDDVSDNEITNKPLAKRIKHLKPKTSPTTSEKLKKPSYHTKLEFENDENVSDASSSTTVETISKVKLEREENEDTEKVLHNEESPNAGHSSVLNDDKESPEETIIRASDDISNYPHFKICYSDAGLKEYICCIDRKENWHYKTTLLISMKKHVQTKHSELWDGYCFVCKVIVTPQGQKLSFKECLQHYLDKHIDNFPVWEKPAAVETPRAPMSDEISPKTYINVRPLAELISTEPEIAEEVLPILPKIESIVSLGAQAEERIANVYPPLEPEQEPEPEPEVPEESDMRYEEVQGQVMSKKHQVVLDTMMSKEKLINVYKCAGRYCSFTSDSVEDALLHASTHQRVGGEGALTCAYCIFDCSGNAIDLVMHVFKEHGGCPYVCGYCFYRAAASQLVAAHAARLHRGLRPSVLASTAIPPNPSKDSTMLPREVVVKYYVCPHACKFRTYTAGKFCEHLQARHPMETWHGCNICPELLDSPAKLVQHMKAHELDVYQCTWCARAADCEAALLAHTASRHPARQPQAYLRVITNKDGSSEFRVLPLASFNKSKVQVEEVAATGNKLNPVREAERSIELEKLIGHTNQLINSTVSTAEATITADTTPDEGHHAENSSEPPIVESPEIQPRFNTPPPMSIEERSQMLTPILKVEPELTTPSKNVPSDVIYCLDSDDDDSSQTADATDISADQSQTEDSQKYIQLPASKVLKCPGCSSIFKAVAGFKRHLNSCITPNSLVKCAHCSLVTTDRDRLVHHYTVDHCNEKSGNIRRGIFLCGVCNSKFYALFVAKKHMKEVHNAAKINVKTGLSEDGNLENTLTPIAPPPKRKLSGASEPPAKMKRYGPLEIDQLPINPILDELVYCSLCEFNTKVRLNMVRHLQFHADQQPVAHSAPINPVPHLETNEKHFDKMTNLASSSIVTRTPEKAATTAVTVTSEVTAAEASRYPKYVISRQRYACGAKDCSYISVDESMFKFHWLTLHSAVKSFKCIHCWVRLMLKHDNATSRDLNILKIMDHLNMHNSSLYGCSGCPFYYYTRIAVENHVDESNHKGAKVIVVREEVDATSSQVIAPTMDLKPWQCGLCAFKSMLRQEIIEHCGRNHQSKMQYKCSHCPFRTSTLDNVTKHTTNSHPGKSGDIFYYFYREGSVPDEDGSPKWMKQRQKAHVSEIKTEVADATSSQVINAPIKPVQTPDSSLAQLLLLPKPVSASVDLNIVKEEVDDTVEPIDALCNKYGQFCEPNGLNYKCPLCKVIMEDTRDAMQSHLYEELKYRRWVCATCSYKAFHSVGLNEHIISEHRGQNQQPIQLPPDTNIEKWVSAFLDHQTAAIIRNKDNLAKQKIMTERPAKPTKPDERPKTDQAKPKPTMAELEKAFGSLGQPSNMNNYCCPKCKLKVKDESSMRDHLEGELTKIRWCCSDCARTFQTYHQAQFHCKEHGPAARVREAERSPALRAAWVHAVLQVQKLSMRCLPLTEMPDPPTPEKNVPDLADNSLLVVRYEENVPTPEEILLRQRVPTPDDSLLGRRVPTPDDTLRRRIPTPDNSLISRKRPSSGDSDEERLVIDEPTTSSVAKKSTTGTKLKCQYCIFETIYKIALSEHLYRHYNMKPFRCALCNFYAFRKPMVAHTAKEHKGTIDADYVERIPLPRWPPPVQTVRAGRPTAPKKPETVPDKVICLVCEQLLNVAESAGHTHVDTRPEFGREGDTVLKCRICFALCLDHNSLKNHYDLFHSKTPIQFIQYQLHEQNIKCCGYCNKEFSSVKELGAHHEAAHHPLAIMMKDGPIYVSDGEASTSADNGKSKDSPVFAPKRIARKSTTKLPVQAVAKKSTTKLPYDFDDSDSEDEYSFYGTKPTPLHNYQNVTTLMSFCNTMMPFTMKKLSEIIKINPSVVVKDVKNKDGSLQ